jgi:hypothetical protein
MMGMEPELGDARDLYEAGRRCLDAGDLEGAVTHFERSAGAFPHFKALELLGEAWLLRGVPLKAIAPLAAATTLNGQGRAPALLAQALFGIGEHIDAHKMACLALDRAPGNKAATTVLEATRAEYEAWSAEQSK